ncbi:MAG TPA: hypothetical protein VKB80_24910 [Kofleriaceae bacterium]|nr:hypothetical protein [Kofleriaceae bacterium]
MTDSPRIGMNLALAAADDVAWHRDQRLAARLLDALEPGGLWFDFALMSLDNEDDEPLDRARLARAAADGVAAIALRSASGQAAASITTHGILVNLRLRTPPLGRRGKRILDGIIAWAGAAAGAAGDRARVESGAVYPIDVSYPARRPPLEHPLVRFGTLVDLLGLDWSRQSLPRAAQAIASAPLPAGATRTRDGDMVVLRWVDDPGDPAELARGCMRQEDWWAAQVDARPRPGWNAAGDRCIVPTGLEPRAPFTLFDAAEGVGYRAVVVMPDGALDGATWQELAQLAAMRRLDDGTPVNRVRLVVPVRDSAIAIAERARERGIDAVVYRGDDDVLWNVMPEGEWRPPGGGEAPGSPRPTSPRGRAGGGGKRGGGGRRR